MVGFVDYFIYKVFGFALPNLSGRQMDLDVRCNNIIAIILKTTLRRGVTLMRHETRYHNAILYPEKIFEPCTQVS